jgi:hypothetical protein
MGHVMVPAIITAMPKSKRVVLLFFFLPIAKFVTVMLSVLPKVSTIQKPELKN